MKDPTKPFVIAIAFLIIIAWLIGLWLGDLFAWFCPSTVVVASGISLLIGLPMLKGK